MFSVWTPKNQIPSSSNLYIATICSLYSRQQSSFTCTSLSYLYFEFNYKILKPYYIYLYTHLVVVIITLLILDSYYLFFDITVKTVNMINQLLFSHHENYFILSSYIHLTCIQFQCYYYCCSQAHSTAPLYHIDYTTPVDHSINIKCNQTKTKSIVKNNITRPITMPVIIHVIILFIQQW